MLSKYDMFTGSSLHASHILKTSLQPTPVAILGRSIYYIVHCHRGQNNNIGKKRPFSCVGVNWQ